MCSQQALGEPIPARWPAAARRHAADLGAAGEQVTIHADLHYGNVLAAQRRPFDILAKTASLDRDLASGWVVTRCADYWLWGLQRGLTIDPARCERILNAFKPRAAS